ncbi:MAG TPA: sterol desaturase family protein [Pirellulales bacterium]|nr:sterol desaturase family protein [Pirellulales bacterium]
MTVAEMLAHWPWLVLYVFVSAVVFLFLRRRSSTDELAAGSVHRSHGFGPSVGLGPIAAAFFRLTAARLLVAALVVAWGVRAALGHWSWWDAAVVVGVAAFWPVQEWLIHVFILHLKPPTLFGRQLDPIIARNHRNHHRNPWDPALGITPPHCIWLYMAGLPGLWPLFLPVPLAATGVATYFVLALNYEWIHYLIHTAYVPRTWFYRRLWHNHRLHHFKNEHYWFGVTMLSGDWLLSTQPTAQATARSETVLSLGVASDHGIAATADAPPLAKEPPEPAATSST